MLGVYRKYSTLQSGVIVLTEGSNSYYRKLTVGEKFNGGAEVPLSDLRIQKPCAMA